MDEQISELLQRSRELIEMSRKVHKEADVIRHRLMIIDFENADVIKRSELRIKESTEIRDSMMPRPPRFHESQPG